MFEIRLITALVLAVPVQVLKRLYRELILHIDFSPTKKNTVRTVVCLIHSDRYMGWEMVFYIFWGGNNTPIPLDLEGKKPIGVRSFVAQILTSLPKSPGHEGADAD